MFEFDWMFIPGFLRASARRGPTWPDWRVALLSADQFEEYDDDPELYEALHDDDAVIGDLDLEGK